jgi:hypothetical protein
MRDLHLQSALPGGDALSYNNHKSTYDAEIMTSIAIGMSLVSANLPNWPHCAEIQ